MTSPQFAQATKQGRYYDIPGYDDVTHVSVTNIINALSKPALIGAASKHAGERAVHQETEWHAIQQEKGDEEARKWISAASRDYMTYAQNLGSAVHFCCEVFDEHCITGPEFGVAFDDYLIAYLNDHWTPKMSEYRGTVAKNIEQIRKHVEQFHLATTEHGLTWLDRERTVFNPSHGYAGTLDGIVEMDGRKYVIDLKTGFVSKDAVPLQLAAYRFASHEVDGAYTRRRTHWVEGGLVLQLKPASYKLMPVRCDVDVYTAFLDVLRTWEWIHEGSKDAIGEVL